MSFVKKERLTFSLDLHECQVKPSCHACKTTIPCSVCARFCCIENPDVSGQYWFHGTPHRRRVSSLYNFLQPVLIQKNVRPILPCPLKFKTFFRVRTYTEFIRSGGIIRNETRKKFAASIGSLPERNGGRALPSSPVSCRTSRPPVKVASDGQNAERLRRNGDHVVRTA